MSANGNSITLTREQASLVVENLDLPARVLKKRWPRIAVGSPLYNRLWDAALVGLHEVADVATRQAAAPLEVGGQQREVGV